MTPRYAGTYTISCGSDRIYIATMLIYHRGCHLGPVHHILGNMGSSHHRSSAWCPEAGATARQRRSSYPLPTRRGNLVTGDDRQTGGADLVPWQPNLLTHSRRTHPQEQHGCSPTSPRAQVQIATLASTPASWAASSTSCRGWPVEVRRRLHGS
jgi:hypothetical protein